jgi:hypothetical protein
MIWILSSRSVLIFFRQAIENWKVIYFFIFYFLHSIFLSNVLILFFQHALTFAVERKIALVEDACSRPLIIIKFYDLHASGIRGAVGEIAFYHKRD